MNDQRPLVLLDVDGVLNALGSEGGLPTAWPQWRIGFATADGTSWPITYAPDLIQRLLTLVETYNVDLQWLTTWGSEANGGLRRLLGLPELAVAASLDDTAQGSSTVSTSLAGATPSAPSHTGQDWWKHQAVVTLRTRWPTRTIIWIDDELAELSRYTRWAAREAVAAIGPNPTTGLTPEDCNILEAALASAASPRRPGRRAGLNDV